MGDTEGHSEKLSIENLRVAYGGVLAVEDVTLTIEPARITGLIGPNGAGKTTLFNAVSGLVQPTSGTVTMGSRDLTKMKPAQRARVGLGRTFQRPALATSLTVRENVSIGAECRRLVAWGEVLGRSVRNGTRNAVGEALQLCGITGIGDAIVGTLPLGKRRLVELARACAAQHRFLLLDEPISGLDDKGADVFRDVLKRLVDQRGTGILLVEHDVTFVLGSCSTIYVLDGGRVVFSGKPSDVADSEVVRHAYLGGEKSEVSTTATEVTGALR